MFKPLGSRYSSARIKSICATVHAIEDVKTIYDDSICTEFEVMFIFKSGDVDFNSFFDPLSFESKNIQMMKEKGGKTN